MPFAPLTTTVVGSYPQPDWLIDRPALATTGVPRVRNANLWRVAPEFLEQAQDDASLLAIRDMERAGVDIISDGEARRESYSNRFATALEGIDPESPGELIRAAGPPLRVPRVVGPLARSHSVQAADVAFLRRNTSHPIKATLPGPFTMAQQVQNDYYSDRASLALAYADCVNQEIKDLFAAGADLVQLDEPWVRNDPEGARSYAVAAINRAVEGINGPTGLHLCFGYAAVVSDKPGRYSFLTELEATKVQMISIEAAQPNLDLSVLREFATKTVVLGVLDLGNPAIETPEAIADRIREALTHLPPERLMIAPDCGMKYLPRETAFRKLRAMTLGTAIVRESLGV